VKDAVRQLEEERKLPATRVFCEKGPELYEGRYGNALVVESDADAVIFSDGQRFEL
jgi:hypothetical protein